MMRAAACGLFGPWCRGLLLAAAAWLAGALPVHAEVQLDLSGVSDAAVAAALRDGFDPVSRAVGTSGDDKAIADAMAERLTPAMRAFGYLEASIAVTGGAGTGDVVLVPAPGPLYRIGSIELRGLDGLLPADDRAALRDFITRSLGQPARAETLARLERDIVYRLEEASYPLAAARVREIAPDVQTATARIRMAFEPGPIARFGAVTIDEAPYDLSRELTALVPFAKGDPYKRSIVDALQATLDARTDLTRARVRLADAVDASGEIAVTLDVVPAPNYRPSLTAPATIALGLVLFLLAARQVALAAGARTDGPVRGLNVLLVIAVAASVLEGLRAVITLAGAG